MDSYILGFFGFIYLWTIVVLIGAYIGSFKDRTAFGAVLSFLVGPLAWFIVLNSEDKRIKCKYCNGPITKGILKCRHCGSSLEWEVVDKK